MTAWKRRFNLFFASSGRANNMAEFFAFMATGSNLFTTAHTFGCRNFRASHGVYMTTSWHLQGYLSPARLTLFDTLITQVLTGMFAWFFSFARLGTFEGLVTIFVFCSYLKWMAEVLTAVTTV